MKDEKIERHWLQEKAIGILITLLIAACTGLIYLGVDNIKEMKVDSKEFKIAIQAAIKDLSTSITNLSDKFEARIETIQYNQTAGGIRVAEELQKLKTVDQLQEQRITRLESIAEKTEQKK